MEGRGLLLAFAACSAPTTSSITNTDRSTFVVVGDPAAPERLPQAPRPCVDNGREWPEAEAAIEKKLEDSTSMPRVILRRSHKERAWDGPSVVTMDESSRSTTTPLAVVFVGDHGGYAIVFAEDERWFCIAIESSGSTTRLQLLQTPPLYDPALQLSPN